MFRYLVQHFRDHLQGRTPLGARRSSRWPSVRRAHLERHPECAVCGGTRELEVHHIRPFYAHPELELQEDNLITLCEANRYGAHCHLLFGHAGNFRRINSTVVEDSRIWRRKILGP